MVTCEHSPCNASPRGSICKAFKDVKSKVAMHAGMSLSFLELAATSPAVGLLPALSPSPRNPSALLQRQMQILHGNYGPRKSSVPERNPISDAEAATSDSLLPQEAHAAPANGACHPSPTTSSCNVMCDNTLITSSSTSSCCHGEICSCSATNEPKTLTYRSLSKHPSSSPDSRICLQCVSANYEVGDGYSSSAICNNSESHKSISASNTFIPVNDACQAIDHQLGTPWQSAHGCFMNILLIFIVTLLSGLDAFIKSLYKKCVQTWKHRFNSLRVSGAGTANKGHGPISLADTDCFSLKSEDLYMGQTQETSKVETKHRSTKLLKSKLKSSFKNLSVQVPRRAFTPIHYNALPSLSSPSSLSSSPSPSLSTSSRCNHSFSVKKRGSGGTPRSSGFAQRLTKSFNPRQPLPCAQCSPTLDIWSSSSPSRKRKPIKPVQCSPTSAVCISPCATCEARKYSLINNKKTLDLMMLASLATFPVALFGLFHGKLVSCGMVMVWLLLVSMVSKVWCRLRAVSFSRMKFE
ncbi:hypothetical protein KP509_18G078000 [Ceratopteris richardii]|nr:hypothetical protein KP509_18G078000 [Ceratopteris richardii]